MTAWHVQFCKDFIVFLSHVSENNDNRHSTELSTRLILNLILLDLFLLTDCAELIEACHSMSKPKSTRKNRKDACACVVTHN